MIRARDIAGGEQPAQLFIEQRGVERREQLVEQNQAWTGHEQANQGQQPAFPQLG